MKYLSSFACLILIVGIGINAWAQTDDWLGSWNYTAPQADYQYQKGIIIFDMDGDKMTAKVDVNGNSIQTSDLTVSEDEASFKIYIEGEAIQVTLRKEKNKLTGKADYSGGSVNINGEKSS